MIIKDILEKNNKIKYFLVEFDYGLSYEIKNLFLNKNYKILKEFILSSQIDNCKGDLRDFGITFDNWFSERSLFENKAIEKIIEVLEKKGLVYFSENALWFKSKEYGDEKAGWEYYEE